VASVAWTAPFVRRQARNVSTAPKASSPRSAAARAPATLSRSQAILVAEKLGVDHKAGRRRHLRLRAFRLQASAGLGRAAVLPHDRVGDRLTRRALPDQRGLALVGDPDRRQITRLAGGAPEGLARGRERRSPQRFRIVLDPARPGVELRKLGLGAGDRRGVEAEHDRAGRGRPLIDDQDHAGVLCALTRRPPSASRPAMKRSRAAIPSALKRSPSLVRRHAISSALSAHSTRIR
jgi:hypothetical protein